MNKVLIIIAASLVGAGLMLFAVAMAMNFGDFTKLSTQTYETNTHDITERFTNISIKTDTADIAFLPSEDEGCRVVCYESTTGKHSVSAQDGTLSVNEVNTKKWYQYIGIGIGSPKITVYLPESEYSQLTIDESTGGVDIPKDLKFAGMDISTSTGYVKSRASASGTVKIKTSTGYIDIANITADSLDLSVTTGKITLADVSCSGDVKIKVSTGKTELTDFTCKNLTSDGSTGRIYLTRVVASEKLYLERSTGDVKFDRCDAAEILVQTDTGDVSGTLLSEKIFTAKTDTGDIDIPRSTAGGRCDITTDTGDIKISISN